MIDDEKQNRISSPFLITNQKSSINNGFYRKSTFFNLK